MVCAYTKLAVRHFRRNQVTSAINLLGLVMGLATCLVAGLYIKHELSADQFHTDLHSIYRVTVGIKDFTMNGTPYLFAETAEKEIPSITSTLRTGERQSNVRIGNEVATHSILFADPHFLGFFTFPLKFGNPEKALDGMGRVVISHEISQRYFAGENAVGKTLQIELDNEFVDFEISGVAKATPGYSTMYFDFVIPMDHRFAQNPQMKNNWEGFFITSFIKTNPGHRDHVEEALRELVTRYIPGEENPGGTPRMRFLLNSFADHHLGEGFSGGGLREGNSGKSLFVFGGIAVVILLLACFNFMHLTNAQSSRRAVEVGIKKVVGAGRYQLMLQFLAESLILSLLAAVPALGIAELSLFAFRDLLHVSISVFNSGHWDLYAGLLMVTVMAGILAGIYPAFVLANLATLQTFKRHFKVSGTNWLTRSILTLQFAVSIILIACAIIMWKQQRFISAKDLGYNKEQVLVIPVSPKDTPSIGFLKNELRKVKEVVDVARSSSAFTTGSDAVHHTTADNKSMFIYMMSIDADFVHTMEMQLVKGKMFNPDDPSPTAILINESLMRELNLQDSIGMQLGGSLGSIAQPTIVGVLKDFHQFAMKHSIEPMMFLNNRSFNRTYLLVRLSPEVAASGLAYVRALWEKILPG